MVEQLRPPTFTQSQPDASSGSMSTWNSGPASQFIDEVRDIVSKVLLDFEKRFLQDLEQRLTLQIQGRLLEIEREQFSLQGQIDRLNSVVGAMPEKRQQSQDVVERNGTSSANHASMR